MAKGKTYELALKIAGRVDSSLKKACLDADENLGKLAKTAEKIGKAAKVAAGITAAAATAVGVAAVKSYTEHEQAVNSMAAATGAAGEELEHLQAAMEGAYQNNFGDSLQATADAVAMVDRNLKNISPDEIQEATEAALALQDTFEYGVEESTRAAAAITKNFGGSAKEAFSLIAAGAQNGLDYSGELIDTINEYSSQFSKLGFTADGMFQLLQSGADSTAWNLDKVGDAIKEFSIRAIDGSDTTVQAFQDLGYNAYVLEVVKNLASIKPYHLKVEYDDNVIEGDFLYGMVSNTTSVGRFNNFPPGNPDLSDGLLEVTLISPVRDVKDMEEFSRALLMTNPSILNSMMTTFSTAKVKFTPAPGAALDPGRRGRRGPPGGRGGGRPQRLYHHPRTRKIAIKLASENAFRKFRQITCNCIDFLLA